MINAIYLSVSVLAVCITAVLRPYEVQKLVEVEVERPVAVIATQPLNVNDPAIKKPVLIYSACRSA